MTIPVVLGLSVSSHHLAKKTKAAAAQLGDLQVSTGCTAGGLQLPMYVRTLYPNFLYGLRLEKVSIPESAPASGPGSQLP